MAASTFALEARRLRQVQERVPAAQRIVMKAAAVEIAQGAARKVSRAGRSPWQVGVRYKGPDIDPSGAVAVEFSPTYLARWQEGGTEPHRIQRGAKARRTLVRKHHRAASRAAKSIGRMDQMLSTGRDAKGKTLSARRRAGIVARRDAAAKRQWLAAEAGHQTTFGGGYVGALSLDRGGNAKPPTGGGRATGFAASVQHPGQRPTRPLRRTIEEVSPRLAQQLARAVNETWLKGV